MRKKLTEKERFQLIEMFKTGNYTTINLSKLFGIPNSTIHLLLHRNGYKTPNHSESNRKYSINESFFDIIDTEEKAYILGLLYADGCNSTIKNDIILSLKETDKEILDKIKILLKSNRPIKYVDLSRQRNKKGFENAKNHYRFIITNKHISTRLTELGCMSVKTFKLIFPTYDQVPKYLQHHFIRGYFDGDGTINMKQTSAIGTKLFCIKLSEIVKEELQITTYMRVLYPNRNLIINRISISGGRQVRTFLKWIYKDATIYLDRKYNIYIKHLEYEEELKKIRRCSVSNCNEKHEALGYCSHHYYKLGGDKERKRQNYIKNNKL